MILSSQTLSALYSGFRYGGGNGPVVLFAFRGCLPREVLKGNFEAAAEFRTSHKLAVTRLNFKTSRCTIGIWNTHDQTVAVFPGSTVPSTSYLFQNPAALKTFNILCPGKYALRRGIHPREADSFQRHEAFLMDGFGLVNVPGINKSGKTLSFSADEPHYLVTLPGDNLHAARTEPQGDLPSVNEKNLAALKMQYSSSGCITIVGQPEKYCAKQNEAWNSWTTFNRQLQNIAAGVSDTFDFLLFQNTDIHLPEKEAISYPLCYGASGNDIEKLQRILSSVNDTENFLPYYTGLFDGQFMDETVRSYLRFERDFSIKSPGIEPDLPAFFRKTRHFLNVKEPDYALD